MRAGRNTNSGVTRLVFDGCFVEVASTLVDALDPYESATTTKLTTRSFLIVDLSGWISMGNQMRDPRIACMIDPVKPRGDKSAFAFRARLCVQRKARRLD
jgi:hypothetical protein